MTGLPDRSNITTFNAAGKVNALNLPPSVPTIDWDNPSLAQAISDVAGLGITAPRFYCRLTLATSTGGLSIPVWEAVWMNATTTAPVAARSSTGVFTITLPTLVSDEYQASLGNTNTHTVNLVAAAATAEGATPCFINASASANIITVHTFNDGGTPDDLSGVTIFVRAF